jgi:phosphoribosylaminoimidazolecarboxamide formyltransferase/IMP cyclohydrolase
MSAGNLVKIRRVLVSVSNKEGIADFARALSNYGAEIISTGGTAEHLRSAGLNVTLVSDLTEFPEILNGRVKTLHPTIHAGLLAVRDNPHHQADLQRHGIEPIDLVVVNLYPFEEMVKRTNVRLEQVIEEIDIGGPAIIRSAAKNFHFTAVVVSPSSYNAVLDELRSNEGALTETTRFKLAREAFRHIAHYDALIASYFEGIQSTTKMPEFFSLSLAKGFDLRYGENPHQAAAFYGNFAMHFPVLHGKPLSYNNILDVDGAIGCAREFTEPTAVIVKHTNPCGVGTGATPSEAYQKALATDPASAFGGIIALNRTIEAETAEAIHPQFAEIIIAPAFSAEALTILMQKKNRRIIQWRSDVKEDYDIRSVQGGILVQEPDNQLLYREELRTVTRRQPTEEELQAMMFAWKVAKHVKSNAIVYARADRTLGIGAGQMSRVDSARIAALKAREAGHDLRGCAAASDAFFPFADGLVEAVKAGATAVIQPGGSIRDNEVIRAADDYGVAMVFTGIRHFKH